MDLDMALVRAYVLCAEELHFGRAAERLSMTQQAISKRITKLESDLGTTLFDRSTRSVARLRSYARATPKNAGFGSPRKSSALVHHAFG